MYFTDTKQINVFRSTGAGSGVFRRTLVELDHIVHMPLVMILSR